MYKNQICIIKVITVIVNASGFFVLITYAS